VKQDSRSLAIDTTWVFGTAFQWLDRNAFSVTGLCTIQNILAGSTLAPPADWQSAIQQVGNLRYE